MTGLRLNRVFLLEERQRTPDGHGGYLEGWHPLGQVWAEVRPGVGREIAGVEVPLSQVGYRITLRAAPMGAPSRPKAGQRLRDAGRSFAILAVAERDGDGRYLTCFAREEEPA